jgi:hypothetical protein
MGIFEAIRRAAAGQEDSPWHQPKWTRHEMDDERHDRVERAVYHATGIGRPRADGRPGMRGGRIETGHHVHIGHDYSSGTRYAELSPPSWPYDDRADTAYLHLGQDDDDVPRMLSQRFGHPEVQQYLRRTISR